MPLVTCSWAVQRGTSCLPKSTKESHLRSNLEAASWRLPDPDFQALSSLATQRRQGAAGLHPFVLVQSLKSAAPDGWECTFGTARQ